MDNNTNWFIHDGSIKFAIDLNKMMCAELRRGSSILHIYADSGTHYIYRFETSKEAEETFTSMSLKLK